MVAIVAVATTITSCKKEESSNTSNTSSSAIVGTWGTTRIETFVTLNDQKVFDSTITDLIVCTFNANGTYTIKTTGIPTPASGTYKMTNNNNIQYLITLPTGGAGDTVVVENITATSFNINGKEIAVRDDEPEYEKIYFLKK